MKTTILKRRRIVPPRRITMRTLVHDRHGLAIIKRLSPANSRIHERLETGVFQCELREHCGGVLLVCIGPRPSRKPTSTTHLCIGHVVTTENGVLLEQSGGDETPC